ncbi:MAG: hypothetical protein IIT58_10520 [Treponema sp.]|nr:hypothetical protein [Treponema sp.]
MFDTKGLSPEAVKILENFDQIVQSIRPMNSKQLTKLPHDIRELSHKLTDQRESRRVGYMNATEELSAYVRYFTWWNLVRLTRVFSNIPVQAFNLKDEDVCLDIGSGPLTVVTALWLSHPELRNLKLNFYCMDIASQTMALGEDIYMSVASQSQPTSPTAPTHWNIIRVKGEIGTPLRKKARFISCANMFNELYQKEKSDPEKIAKNQLEQLLSYADADPSVFIAEPASPISAHFVSLMRDNLLSKKMNLVSPCCHTKKCPMSGLHARYGGTAKWCNFSFSTENAPKKLLKLSDDAGLPKERASLSFVFANSQSDSSTNKEEDFILRVASDPIWLPGNRQGFYCCSEKGLILAVNTSHSKITSGQKLVLKTKTDFSDLLKDKKTGSLILNI